MRLEQLEEDGWGAVEIHKYPGGDHLFLWFVDEIGNRPLWATDGCQPENIAKIPKYRTSKGHRVKMRAHCNIIH